MTDLTVEQQILDMLRRTLRWITWISIVAVMLLWFYTSRVDALTKKVSAIRLGADTMSAAANDIIAEIQDADMLPGAKREITKLRAEIIELRNIIRHYHGDEKTPGE